MEQADIEVPTFQREFVWTLRQAARFIESLLLGLPVPGVFFWRNPASQRLVVVDGQQRLRTLQHFYDGVLRGKEFRLPKQTSPYQTVHPSFQGKTYKTLDDEQRRRLDNSIIHATIVQQEHPNDDDSSIYYLFERINTEGSPLQPQEIRSAVYRGALPDALAALNQNDAWRTIFGPASSRMKDQELILRFFALSDATFPDETKSGPLGVDTYARPMKEFLNRYARRHKDLDTSTLRAMSTRFTNTVEAIDGALGRQAFRPSKALNAAVFDAVMVGLDRRLRQSVAVDRLALREAYLRLLENDQFKTSYTRATADTDSVRQRIKLATEAFSDLP